MNEEVLPFAIMAREDELIKSMYTLSNSLKARHFQNYVEVKSEIHRKTYDYYMGNISPLDYYEYCLNIVQEYVSRCSFQTHKTEELELLLDGLVQDEKEFYYLLNERDRIKRNQW